MAQVCFWPLLTRSHPVALRPICCLLGTDACPNLYRGKRDLLQTKKRPVASHLLFARHRCLPKSVQGKEDSQNVFSIINAAPAGGYTEVQRILNLVPINNTLSQRRPTECFLYRMCSLQIECLLVQGKDRTMLNENYTENGYRGKRDLLQRQKRPAIEESAFVHPH